MKIYRLENNIILKKKNIYIADQKKEKKEEKNKQKFNSKRFNFVSLN